MKIPDYLPEEDSEEWISANPVIDTPPTWDGEDLVFEHYEWHESEHGVTLEAHGIAACWGSTAKTRQHIALPACTQCYDRGYVVLVGKRWPYAAMMPSPCGCLEQRSPDDVSRTADEWFGIDISRADPYAIEMWMLLLRHRQEAMNNEEKRDNGNH